MSPRIRASTRGAVEANAPTEIMGRPCMPIARGRGICDRVEMLISAHVEGQPPMADVESLVKGLEGVAIPMVLFTINGFSTKQVSFTWEASSVVTILMIAHDNVKAMGNYVRHKYTPMSLDKCGKYVIQC
ncbi:Uncharacterized protein TCM_043661 [Theobroma cacao]|uniref:Uncharacterized protein n=1 Tax=Theobroma cacao TaxID=3641 RepID=A0A061FW32_THECC|nr:Uncharacterized protein TCM_043661 [Theobroma cacao]